MRSWKYPKSSRWADLSVASLPPSSWNSGSSAAMHTVVRRLSQAQSSSGRPIIVPVTDIGSPSMAVPKSKAPPSPSGASRSMTLGRIISRWRSTALTASAFFRRACRSVCRGGSVTASCCPCGRVVGAEQIEEGAPLGGEGVGVAQDQVRVGVLHDGPETAFLVHLVPAETVDLAHPAPYLVRVAVAVKSRVDEIGRSHVNRTSGRTSVVDGDGRFLSLRRRTRDSTERVPGRQQSDGRCGADRCTSAHGEIEFKKWSAAERPAEADPELAA